MRPPDVERCGAQARGGSWGSPFGLAFAAGAMLYVVVDEPIPESHARGNERAAAAALPAGFALMLTLDNAFG